MGQKDIQSVFSQCRNVARKNNPSGVPLINKLERICLSNYNGKLSTEKARIAVRSALFEHNQNPSMLDMAEAQAKSSKMLAIVPDYIPSTQGKSVVGLLNQKPVKQKVYSSGIFANVNMKQTKPVAFMGKQIKQSKPKGLIFSPSIVGGKVNNNKTVFGNFTNKKQIQTKGIFANVNMKQSTPSKGIFSGVNMNPKTGSGNGIFENIKSSKPIRMSIMGKSRNGMSFAEIKMQKEINGLFSGIKQNKKSKSRSIIELMNEGKK